MHSFNDYLIIKTESQEGFVVNNNFGEVVLAPNDCVIKKGQTVYFDYSNLKSINVNGKDIKYIKLENIIAYE